MRAGFPCFGAALVGYVEATRDDHAERNRLCAPSSYGVALNPARIPPEHPGSARLDDALARIRQHAGPGLERLDQLGR